MFATTAAAAAAAAGASLGGMAGTWLGLACHTCRAPSAPPATPDDSPTERLEVALADVPASPFGPLLATLVPAADGRGEVPLGRHRRSRRPRPNGGPHAGGPPPVAGGGPLSATGG